uniref:PiggyBac transposable element-derived protein domain-containing protein n=1 Tax=Dicentrarchus labrax TaxID=13489 RepID=A0A8P4KD33_DICLA
VDTHAAYKPLDLLQLYFSPTTGRTLCTNTNKRAEKSKEMGKKYKWADVEVEELYKFLGLLTYTSLVPLPSITDYWKQNTITSVPFPATVMARDRFRALLWNIHPSDPEEDNKNYEKKGTPEYNKVFRIKPLIDDILSACQAHYHPRRELAVDERMVATKAKTGMTQYMKDKPTRWGIKLFVSVDSSNGYTVNFDIYTGNTHIHTHTHTHRVLGLSYDAVMHLIQPSYLGAGYHVYMDNFYTSVCLSPVLFQDLLQKRIWACGTIRTNRIGFPRTKDHSLDSKSSRGSIHYTPSFSFSGEIRGMSPCVQMGSGRCMGGVDLSDAPMGYYKVLHKTQRWYKTFFYHFMDIAIVNAFLLHKAIAIGKGEKPLIQEAFKETLAEQLAQVGSPSTARPVPPTRPPRAQHRPVYITGHSTDGRLKCRQCHAKTPLKMWLGNLYN